MSSESVWLEQVDTALITYLKRLFPKYLIFMRKPDEDFKIEAYPCISIYCTGYRRDTLRYFDKLEDTGEIIEEKFIKVYEKSAVPYNLDYQVEFWAKTQTEMNLMTRLLLGNTPEGYINLPVVDMSGNNRNSFMSQSASVVRSDLLNGKNRIFRTIFSYIIWVELDEKVKENINYINTVETNISQRRLRND